MKTAERTPVALFVALTRAVREAPVSEGARHQAYDIINRMALAVGRPGFEIELQALVAFATREPRFFQTFKLFSNELLALSAPSVAHVEGAPRDR